MMNLPSSHPFPGFDGMNPQLINGMPASMWCAMSDERRAAYMRDKRKVDAYRTEMCKQFIRTGGHCSYGILCRFAHDESELRLRPVHPKYKTELCRNYSNSLFCPYGQRCQFIHRSPPSSRPVAGANTPPPPGADRLAMLSAFSPAVPGFALFDDDYYHHLMQMPVQPPQYSQSLGPGVGLNSMLHHQMDDPALLSLNDIFAIWQPLADESVGTRNPSSSSTTTRVPSGGDSSNSNEDAPPPVVQAPPLPFGFGGNFSRSCLPTVSATVPRVKKANAVKVKVQDES